MTGFFERMTARATGTEQPLRLRRPEPFEPLALSVPTLRRPSSDLSPGTLLGLGGLQADVLAAAQPARSHAAAAATADRAGDPRPPREPLTARPRPATAPDRGSNAEGDQPSAAEAADRSSDAGTDRRGPRHRTAPAAPPAALDDIERAAAAAHGPREATPTDDATDRPPRPARGSWRTAGPPAADAAPPVRAARPPEPEPSVPSPAASDRREPGRPAEDARRVPVDVTMLLREPVMALLRARGAVGPHERPLVREADAAPDAEVDPAPGTVVLQPVSTTVREVPRPGNAVPERRRPPPAVPTGPPHVQVHIDRVLVTRAPVKPPTPEAPPRRSTVDHEAYLARRRERR